MSANILITGGAGYIGGSVLTGLLADGAFKPANITAIVRTDEQNQKISKLGVNVLQIDLTDGAAITKAVSKQDVDIVIHCASSMNGKLALPLIEALGQRIKKSGKTAYFVHTSGTTAYGDKSGWDHGPVKDTDDVLDLEKRASGPYVLRETNIAINECAEKAGVTPIVIAPPLVYGKGTGECGKESYILPSVIRASIELGQTYRFATNAEWPAVHVADLVDYYLRLVERIASGAGNVTGYYFPVAHYIEMWEMLEHVAVSLNGKGLIPEPAVAVWPNEEFAAKAMNLPDGFVAIAWYPIMTVIPEKGPGLGWKPIWDRAKFLQSMDDEVEAARSVDNEKLRAA